jgi:hypothetical protein
MKKYDDRFSISSSRYRNPLMIVLLACILSSCNKSPNRPVPPQAPPKPKAQVMPAILASDMQKALFIYSSRPLFHYENGQGPIMQRHVIRT